MNVKVTLGHLVCDEYGTTGSAKSKPGDQTGKESRLQEWYNNSTHPWEYVFRPKSTKLGKAIAEAMTTICVMPNLGGYNQTRRTTLAKNAKAHNWKLKEVTEACESDCSASVAVCLNASGVPISIDMYTGNEKQLIEATGQFKTFTAKKYIASPNELKVGDILLKKGHTAVVVKVEVIAEYYPKYTGDSNSIVDALSSLGVTSTLTNRKKIAAANGMTEYTGTANQNRAMLALLEKGKLIRP